MHELEQFFTEVKNRGTKQERDLWLALKPLFQVHQKIDEETGEEYETFDIDGTFSSS